MSIQEIQDDRVAAAEYAAKDCDATLVLKGAGTVIAHPQRDALMNLNGNSGMATAGSGDVLSGVIASLVGQGMDAFDAARLGVHLHGVAGDIVAESLGPHGLMASDILEALPAAFLAHAAAG